MDQVDGSSGDIFSQVRLLLQCWSDLYLEFFSPQKPLSTKTLMGTSWWKGGISLQAAPGSSTYPGEVATRPELLVLIQSSLPPCTSGLRRTLSCYLPSHQCQAVPGEHGEPGLLLPAWAMGGKGHSGSCKQQEQYTWPHAPWKITGESMR